MLYRQIVSVDLPLRPYVKNIMISDFNQDFVQLPAMADVQMVFYLQGGSAFVNHQGEKSLAPVAFVAGPSLYPRAFCVEQNSIFVAITFKSAGFFACFGVPVSHLREAYVDLNDFLSPMVAQSLFECLSSAQDNLAIIKKIEIFLYQQLHSHKKKLPLLPLTSWQQCFVPIKQLAHDLHLSTRQLERRFLMQYGLCMRDSRRMIRFSQAMHTIMKNDQKLILVDVALSANYTDQAHFSKDFRQFVGMAPSQFLQQRLAADSDYALWQMAPSELQIFIGDE